jgi:hypothetical protein
MIELPNLLIVGRYEEETEESKWILERLKRIELQAERSYLNRWPDEPDRWKEWNVMALPGTYGKWMRFEFQRWERLGRDVVPVLKSRLTYVPILDLVDPLPVADDPPVLHHSWKLVPKEVHPDEGADEWLRKGWHDRIQTIEKQLGNRGFFSTPLTQTRGGWERMLRFHRLKIEHRNQGIHLVEVPEEDLCAG